MSIGLPDTKLLWGRSGGLCNICKIKLSEDKKTSNEAFPFGEQAHIVAEEEDGPRGKSLLTLDQRNSYHNLILLCPTHHTIIDKSPEEHPVEMLHQIKSQHELWFEKSRVSAADKVKQANDYIYADIVDTAAKLCVFENWESWTSHPLSASPSWQKEWMDNVEELRRRIIRAVWPGTIPELERALKTLSLNLTMALKVFCEHCEMGEEGWFREVKFYKVGRWNENYDRDLAAYKEWLKEHDSFIYEATKSANWVADVVRRELNPSFFAVPGKFVVTSGPNMEGNYVTRVLEYSEEQKKAEPEAIAAKFKAVREAEQKRAKELWGED
jgi:hypothetical protein